MFVVSKLCLQAFTEWFQRKTDGSCTWLWTPYSDEEKEGVFLNMNSQEQASFLPWKQNQPNGGREENFVKIDMNLFQDENKVKFCLNLTKSNCQKKVELVDSGGDSPGCASCQLHNFLLLHLEGLCDHSFLG